MHQKRSNPAPLETVAGLGNVASGQVVDIARNTSPHHLRQARLLQRRFHLSGSLAAVVAGVAFAEAAR